MLVEYDIFIFTTSASVEILKVRMLYVSLKYVCVRQSWFIVNYPEHTHLQAGNLIKFGQDTGAGSISRVKMGVQWWVWMEGG